MYLSKLEVVGFKSFAQKVSLSFAEGITAIVGPNGCGKTNIVDAIRWVLGEQRAGVLRSEIMENVIFNGTSSRRPLGMAEVTLVIENNRNVLPIEYSEVSVTRRLFRSGDSDYLMNNARCRLRDITDLFMDTGMGADSYSVIELKMVEDILSGKPEERRRLFEEAAGVNKYKLRRKEAVRKLTAVQTDMTRIKDILAEVQKNVNSLSRQAAKTRRYNNLTEELKAFETKYLAFEFDHYRNENGVLLPLFEKQTAEKSEREKEISLAEEALIELKSKLNSANEELKIALTAEATASSEISGLKTEIAVTEEKISSGEKSYVRLNSEIENAKIRSAETEIRINEIKAQAEKLKAEHSEADIDSDELKSARDAAYSKLAELREEINRDNEALINLQNRIGVVKSSLQRNRLRKETCQIEIDRAGSEIERLNQTVEALRDEEKSGEESRIELKEKISKAEIDLNSARERQTELQNTIDELGLEIADVKNSLSSSKTMLEFLHGLADSPDESSKYLLNSGDWNPSKKVILEELVGTDEKFRVAVESALGEAAGRFVVESSSEAAEAIGLLRKSGKGKAGFAVKDMTPSVPAPSELVKADGVLGFVSEIVRADDAIRNMLRGILGSMVIVTDSSIAESLTRSGACESAVTLDGEIFSSKGYIKGGSVLKTEGIRVGKIERISELENLLDRDNAKLTELEERYRAAKSEIASIDLRAYSEAVRTAENELNKCERAITELKLRAESAMKSADMITASGAKFAEEIQSLDAESDRLVSESDELETALASAKEKHFAGINEINSAEKEYEERKNQAYQAELETVKRDAEIRNLDKEIESLERQLNNLETSGTRFENELITGSALAVKLKSELDNLHLMIESASEKHSEASARTVNLKALVGSLSEQSDQYSADIGEMRKMFEKSIEELHKTELKIGEINLHIETLGEKALESYGLNIEEIEYVPDPDFNPGESKKEIASIKEKLTALGNVNFMALEEYQEQYDRLVFYERQIKDLVESERNLLETITEINQTAEDMFRKTFDEVHRNFKQLFGTLFGEDAEAELRLADDNLLETDIEIIAKPPSKRPHSIEMLSGGEKTLTAIALLFGIYLVKPSPFCILDEVDAPLDDVNIDKYINLIRTFTNKTQFLIVTHNKRSMEAADNLYGITMQEEGVSQVVSVKLSKN